MRLMPNMARARRAAAARTRAACRVEGNTYLMKDFPRMDYVKKATIER